MINKRIVAINDTVHDQVQKLLPWFVVNTLKGEEQALVNQHLHVCPVCQADFAWQCKLQAVAPDTNDAPDVDRAFAKLRERIDAGDARSRAVNSQQGQGWLTWLSNPPRSWMQWSLAGQLAVIAVLVVVIVSAPDDPKEYRALGSGGSTGNQGNLVVSFKPETTEQTLRTIVNAAGARIVDGPTVTDAYLLQVPDEKLTATANTLRRDNHVTLAQPFHSAGQR